MLTIQVRVYSDDKETYWPHDFTWDAEKLEEFFPFLLTFINASYETYGKYEIEVGYEAEEDKD